MGSRGDLSCSRPLKTLGASQISEKKILFTLLVIIVFRFGSVIPVPFLDAEALRALMDSVMGNNNGTALSYLDMLSGGAFSNATLFAMGVSPYINSSIIMQLLTVAIRPLERMAKEGEEGPQKDCYHHPVCYRYPGSYSGHGVLFLPAQQQRGWTEHCPLQRRWCRRFL